MLEVLFGGKTAAQVLIYITYLGEGHIRGIASDLHLSPGQVDRTVKRFESGGLIVAKSAGRTRVYSLSPHFPFRSELTALVDRGIQLMTPEEKAPYIQRRRPRRTGKRL